MGKIGLVTVLFNSDAMLPDFFTSIALQDYKDYVLYLIDNTPSDSTQHIVKKYTETNALSKVFYLPSAGNIGVAAGNNIGIKAALADGCSHVLLLNNDIEFSQPHLLKKITELASSSQYQLVVPKIFYPNSRKIWMAGGYMDSIRALGVHEGYKKNDEERWNHPHIITYAPTCFMIIQKEVFDEVGLMDERYFAYYDDTDFVYRAIQAGFTMFYEPSLEIIHKVSSSSGENSNFYVYHSNRNKIYFVRKHYAFWHQLIVYGYVLLSRFIFWLSFDKSRKKSLLKGLRDGFQMPVTK